MSRNSNIDKHSFFTKILFGFILCSCSVSNEYYEPDTLKQVKLEFNVADKESQFIDSILTSDIVGVHACDNYVIVLTNTSGSLINIYDVSTNKKISSFGDKGNAKNEFNDMFYHTYIKNENGNTYLYVTQAKGAITKVVDLNKSLLQNKCCISKVIKHNENASGLFFKPFFLDSTTLFCYKEVSYTDIRDKIFCAPTITMYKDGKCNVKNIYPKTIKNEMINAVMAAYSAKMSISPDFTKFVHALKFVDIVDILNLQTMENIGIVNPDSYDFEYFENRITESNFSETLKLYNADVYAGDDHFFLLKTTGKTLKFLNENMGKPYKKYIFMYDWNGALINSFGIKDGWSHIAYNEKSRTLYGACDDGRLFCIKL